MVRKGYMETAKLIVSIIGLGGTFIAAVIAVRSFIRTEQWKKAEFLAHEMKEFFANEQVRTALTLIDWGARDVKLLDQQAVNKGKVFVTRQMQVRALLPHTLKSMASDAVVFHVDPVAENEDERYFSSAEAAIRDCYDTFLDGLETFSSYVQTELISIDNLRPYLEYWIDDIHAETKDADDAAWSAALATYITFYRFQGVLWLFTRFGRSIGPASTSYRSFISNMTDRQLADNLLKTARESELSRAV